jgi:hypothetical protein
LPEVTAAATEEQSRRHNRYEGRLLDSDLLHLFAAADFGVRHARRAGTWLLVDEGRTAPFAGISITGTPWHGLLLGEGRASLSASLKHV